MYEKGRYMLLKILSWEQTMPACSADVQGFLLSCCKNVYTIMAGKPAHADMKFTE